MLIISPEIRDSASEQVLVSSFSLTIGNRSVQFRQCGPKSWESVMCTRQLFGSSFGDIKRGNLPRGGFPREIQSIASYLL